MDAPQAVSNPAARTPTRQRDTRATVVAPQARIEFEVADVAAAAAELTAKGYRLIHETGTEPWTQITARLLSPEGLLVAVCYTPSFHDTGDG